MHSYTYMYPQPRRWLLLTKPTSGLAVERRAQTFLYCGGGGGGGGGTSEPATICFITRVKTQPDGDSAAHPLLSCAQETD